MKFVFDLDGTLCFKGNPVSKGILECLYHLYLQGHEIIFASARPIRDVLPVIDMKFYNFTIIGCNGAIISHEGKIVFKQGFDKVNLERILDLVKEFQATYLIDGDWDYSYTGPDNHPILNNIDSNKLANSVHISSLDSIIKILILTSKDMNSLHCKLKELNVVLHRYKSEDILDISPHNIDKWNALKILGVKCGEYFAFGNDLNDLNVFKNSRYSVMIGCNHELLKFSDEMLHLDSELENNIIKKLINLGQTYPKKNRYSQFCVGSATL